MVWLFLALRLPLGWRAISSTLHLRMLLSGHFLLLMLSAHLLLMMLRTHLLADAGIHLLLIHRMLAVGRASLLAAFAGTHFSLVSLKVLVVAVKIFCLVFVPVFFGIHPFSLPAMFSHLPGLVLTLSCSSFAGSANALSA